MKPCRICEFPSFHARKLCEIAVFYAVNVIDFGAKNVWFASFETCFAYLPGLNVYKKSKIITLTIKTENTNSVLVRAEDILLTEDFWKRNGKLTLEAYLEPSRTSTMKLFCKYI